MVKWFEIALIYFLIEKQNPSSNQGKHCNISTISLYQCDWIIDLPLKMTGQECLFVCFCKSQLIIHKSKAVLINNNIHKGLSWIVSLQHAQALVLVIQLIWYWRKVLQSTSQLVLKVIRGSVWANTKEPPVVTVQTEADKWSENTKDWVLGSHLSCFVLSLYHSVIQSK